MLFPNKDSRKASTKKDTAEHSKNHQKVPGGSGKSKVGSSTEPRA